MNNNRNKLNQPPSGEGKKQSPRSGEANKLNKRSEVLQATGAEQNIGTAEEEEALRSKREVNNPKRPKAGRWVERSLDFGEKNYIESSRGRRDMPKDKKRNIGSYQIQGGNLNEFEFQKSQSEMAEGSDPPVAEPGDANVSQAKHIAEVSAEAHRKVEKRRRHGLTKKAQVRSSSAVGKKSAKKKTRKAATKTLKRSGTKKSASVKGRR
jgi:hypothetical protein